VDLAVRYAHRMVVLADGRIVADLPAAQALPAEAGVARLSRLCLFVPA
jgi:ABC-type phosphate/phosphonate transport system ATPase subunit